jgi:hypothetical protein
MGYDSYRDSNGVTWTVVATANGFTLLGTVLDEADPKYDPPVEDVTASMAQGGVQVGGIDIIHTDPPTAEQTRVLFAELAGKMEAIARAHRGQALLAVKASAPVPWWVWALLGVAILRRRR